ncbi:hypothetical protein HG537_0H00280 [Torulaspora globosa]|uniref:Suppressor of lethality of KEX2 GAS1 double null mutant protein 1 n=1 Tax=Torulaspora globosa TaxID=48254 RepID=A0A7H9I0A4_9SACH|nr:hypothetical protein HG537_0H00280 [Torulaspora sp. CBS 2947]
MATISIAVGCAVGIPIGLGLVVALFFWARMQRRLRKEEEEDKELQNVLQDNASITFGNLESLKQPVTDDIAKEDTQVFVRHDHKTSDHHISGSGSSDGSMSHEEKLSASAAGNDKGMNSKLFVPAYRRKINTFQAKLTQSAGNSTRNSSSTSLNSSQKIPKTQLNVYDQMIPVVTTQAQGIFDDNEEKDRQSSNEHLIRNLNNQDFGSYPRRASSSSLSQLHSTNHSSSSFHTRASSMSSALKPGAPAENVFATPKSEKALGNKSRTEVDRQDRQGKQDDVYLLKNNYDITNSGEIAEEDQYENEFTNYSANKREFIDTLRPKKL